MSCTLLCRPLRRLMRWIIKRAGATARSLWLNDDHLHHATRGLCGGGGGVPLRASALLAQTRWDGVLVHRTRLAAQPMVRLPAIRGGLTMSDECHECAVNLEITRRALESVTSVDRANRER